MHTLLRIIWIGRKTFAFWTFFLGVLYIPADLYGLKEEYPQTWGRVERAVGVIGREDIYLALAVAAGLWLAWSDFRPLAGKWLEKRRRGALDFVLPAHAQTSGRTSRYSTHQLFDYKGQGSFSVGSTYFIGVRNNSGRTIRNVRVDLEGFSGGDGYFPLKMMTGLDESTVDIQPGSEALFRIGQQWYWRDANEKLAPSRALGWQLVSEPGDGPFFYLNDIDISYGFLIGPGGFDLDLTAYADDVAPRHCRLCLTLGPETLLEITSQSSRRR